MCFYFDASLHELLAGFVRQDSVAHCGNIGLHLLHVWTRI